MRTHLSKWLCGLVALLAALAGPAFAGDWSRFRGPNGSGISSDSAPTPIRWSPTENLKWKVDLPGPGVSCPIVIGDRVFVTCYSGYGVDPNDVGEQKDLKRHLVCVDRASGEILWNESVAAVLPEDPYSGPGVPQHGYASHSPVSDGERVYVFFGKTGALAYNMDGKKLWQTSVGTGSDQRRFGSASSPIVYRNLLIVTAAPESQALVGLDKQTGEEVWRQSPPGLSGTWSTPVLAPVDDERTDLVIGVPGEIWGLNPETGQLRWYAPMNQSDQYNSSVVFQDGVVYATEGRGGGAMAVRGGGRGDVTESHVLWRGPASARFGAPIVQDGLLYSLNGDAIVCLNAKTGARVYQERLSADTAAPGQGRPGGRGRRGGGRDYSSPVAADGKLYYVRGNGDTYVVKLGDDFVQLAVNEVTDENETFSASPAISNGEIYIRSDARLYCVANE